MRRGINPLYRVSAPDHLPSMVASVITHLPNRVGYHAQRLEIVKACLVSMRNGAAGIPVMVWDNGSCGELRMWLRDVYHPEYLVLSPNVGKSSARASIVHMFPPETIIGISDDDMLFYPDWMYAHLALLDGFPNVGAVSGWPVRVSFGWGNENTIAWAHKNGAVECGRFIADDQERDYAVSVGMDEHSHAERTAAKQDVMITYNGLWAYAEAQHCQFMAYAGRIAQFCGYSNQAMGTEIPFDNAIDGAGLLRLTTIGRYTWHMGNIIDDGLRAELNRMGL